MMYYYVNCFLHCVNLSHQLLPEFVLVLGCAVEARDPVLSLHRADARLRSTRALPLQGQGGEVLGSLSSSSISVVGVGAGPEALPAS
jgi:hypothetical protein